MTNYDDNGRYRLISLPQEFCEAAAHRNDSKLLPVALLVTLAATVFYLAKIYFMPGDYVGADNDDVMRLVEVRDYLAGQNWFDMMQYRLGPVPGTLMHWSRLVDLPIAALISFFRFFTTSTRAEAIALFIWPMFLRFPVIYFSGLAGRRIGGERALYPATILAALVTVSAHKFDPGSIDHHNVQMALIAIIVSMLVDPKNRFSNYAVAGLASAFALAVGAETTPIIAVAAILVALCWGLKGEAFRNAAIGFGLVFGLMTAAFFLSTTSPARYFVVTCDALSFGYMALAAFGGLALAAAAVPASRLGIVFRFAALGVIGLAAGVLALKVMPQCLQNPMNSLDPLLKSIWLDNIQEAHSFTQQLSFAPETIGGFYLMGLLAMIVAGWRIYKCERAGAYAVFLALLATAWGISLVQLRGSIFADLIAVAPLSVLLAELHALSRQFKDQTAAGIPFAVMTLASVPAFWFVMGAVAVKGTDRAEASQQLTQMVAKSGACVSADNLTALNALPKGMIAAPSNMGSPILRYTEHSVLAAPYHRDQVGMLALFRAGLAKPHDAEVILGNVGTDYFVYCPGDNEIAQLAQLAPNGFFAMLKRRDVPPFLRAVSLKGVKGIRAFKLVR